MMIATKGERLQSLVSMQRIWQFNMLNDLIGLENNKTLPELIKEDYRKL
jgi:hypothetical protein